MGELRSLGQLAVQESLLRDSRSPAYLNAPRQPFRTTPDRRIWTHAQTYSILASVDAEHFSWVNQRLIDFPDQNRLFWPKSGKPNHTDSGHFCHRGNKSSFWHIQQPGPQD